MLKRIKLWYKLNKFYSIFADALGTVDHVSFKALKDDFVLASCAFDVAEALECYDESDKHSRSMFRWLNSLFTDLYGTNTKIW